MEVPWFYLNQPWTDSTRTRYSCFDISELAFHFPYWVSLSDQFGKDRIKIKLSKSLLIVFVISICRSTGTSRGRRTGLPLGIYMILVEPIISHQEPRRSRIDGPMPRWQLSGESLATSNDRRAWNVRSNAWELHFSFSEIWKYPPCWGPKVGERERGQRAIGSSRYLIPREGATLNQRALLGADWLMRLRTF